jgi:hypothetical protein
MANLTSILPTSALPTDAAPTALPSGYETAAPAAPTGDASSPEIGEGGMTLQQLLDWLAYLLKKGFQGHTVADGEGGAGKRNHARALKVN